MEVVPREPQPILWRSPRQAKRKEGVGFEPTGLLHPSVFETDALDQTQPPLRVPQL